MPLLRINATTQGLQLHDRPQPAETALASHRETPGPAIVMVHGYKYAPGDVNHCPHDKIFAAKPGSWPTALGFGAGRAAEGLGIAFGWHARGSLWQMHRRAAELGQTLAALIRHLRTKTPHRPVHVIAHSLGTEIALSALEHLSAHDLDRMVLLTGASFSSHAQRMLQTPAGLTTEVFNVVSRENDLFDLAFENLVTAPVPGDTAIGQGIDAPNVTTVQLDCPRTLSVFTSLRLPVAPPQRRVCHWSTYTRPGVMALYTKLLRDPEQLPQAHLARLLPETPAPRWARFRRSERQSDALPQRAISMPSLPLALRWKTRIMPAAPAQGKQNEHAY
ncbi:alpha/beta hydrolase [Roseobacter sp. YSTF-M11]|uniref:Alpha/beta hydrolase n=1 Tax=Roseobacter insulae TaxID=2859783 RepID=A0A9X1FZK4_9RHOB|nr:alpha/beta hydrolase [Roseobacter insulae]MBW4710527.1 alpha/beta hydrolase [Roseobacter insulae]